MTRHSAAAHRGTPRTSRQLRSRSVSQLCSIEQRNLWEKEMSISQLVLVSRETRTMLTTSFLKTPKLRKWSIAQMHRLGPYLMNRDKWLSQKNARKLVLTNSKAAHERRILQEALWRQQMDFRGHGRWPIRLAVADFGQSNFGQSIFGHRVWPANFGQSIFGQN